MGRFEGGRRITLLPVVLHNGEKVAEGRMRGGGVTT